MRLEVLRLRCEKEEINEDRIALWAKHLTVTEYEIPALEASLEDSMAVAAAASAAAERRGWAGVDAATELEQLRTDLAAAREETAAAERRADEAEATAASLRVTADPKAQGRYQQLIKTLYARLEETTAALQQEMARHSNNNNNNNNNNNSNNGSKAAAS